MFLSSIRYLLLIFLFNFNLSANNLTNELAVIEKPFTIISENDNENKKVNNLLRYIRQNKKEPFDITFRITNKSNKKIEQRISIKWKNADIKLYIKPVNETTYKSADKIKFKCVHVYDLVLNPNTSYDIRIKYNNQAKNDEFYYLKSGPSDEVLCHVLEYEKLYHHGFFFSLILILFLQNIITFIISKDKNIFYFIMYQASILGIISNFRFLIYDIVNNETISFFILKALLPELSSIFFIIFFKSIFYLKKDNPIINKIANILIAIHIFIICYKGVFIETTIAINNINIIFLLFIYPIFDKVRKTKDIAYILFLLCILIHILFMIYFPFNHFYKIDSINFITHMQILTAIESIFINFSLHHRVREIYLQKQKDIIYKKNAKKMLLIQSKNAALGKMLGNIIHQWRQPINNVSLILANLQFTNEYSFLTKEKTEQKFNQIDDQLKYMSSTLEDFKTFFIKKDEIETILLQDVCRKAISLNNSIIKSTHIEVVEVYEDTKYRKIVENELIQVLLILITNSKDSFILNHVNKCKILIKTTDTSITIEDNAGGIPANIIDKVFNHSFSTKKEADSMGLGLYMANEIVEKHLNGYIELKSKDNNTCFKIIFKN